MTTYLKEISTGKIHKFQEGESPVFPELFIPATQIEIDELLLNEAKTQKYIELIEAYNIAISKPHPIVNAPKLDKLNKPIGFTDAEFLIKDPSILKQETTIVFGGLFLTILKYFELLNPAKHNETLMTALKSAIPIPYLTKNKAGEEVKIALTGAENFSIFKHLFERVQKESSKFDNLKNQIDNAQTIEDLNKININITL
jgi:hypothetical protein